MQETNDDVKQLGRDISGAFSALNNGEQNVDVNLDENPVTVEVNGNGLSGIQVKVNPDKVDETWLEDGYIQQVIHNLNLEGKDAGESNAKLITAKAYTNEAYAMLIMGKNQAFIPNEAVDRFLRDDLERRFRDTFEMPDFKIESIDEKISHKGMTKHWEVRTNQFRTISGAQVGDDLQLGFVVRNGYDTGTALGVDLFTFRLVCSNGAIAKGVDLASETVRHISKNPKELLKKFETGLMSVVADWTELIALYQKFADTRLNKKMAQYIWDRTRQADISQRFFPVEYNLPKDEKPEKEHQIELAVGANGETITLWDNYNSLTDGLYHSLNPSTYPSKDGKRELTRKALSYESVAWREKVMHESLKYIVDNPEQFA